MRRKISFFIILLLLIVLGYGIFYVINFYTTRQVFQAYENYQNIFKNDTYGGATPEETLKLFITALKEGDIDQATLYFMPDDKGSREKWREVLEEKNLDSSGLLSILSQAHFLSSVYDGQKWYQSFNGNKEVLISFVNNGQVWKIESL